ncbi:hypothetical protein GCM10010145_68340 [Streptomyces ruber]|uniref:Uncharacterized protein n=1 Tax=Streptomyces ruber TaxID=83378 RepID=A0A918BS99_9ACTN|nr:hypothetical protein GCM10010145_68340 [Streptomyces ruber]
MGWPGVAGRGGRTLDQGGNLELFVDRELADEHTTSVSVAGPLDVEAVHPAEQDTDASAAARD